MPKRKLQTELLTKDEAVAKRSAALKSKKIRRETSQRTDCVENVNYKPQSPCEAGKEGLCCWGTQDATTNNCMHAFVKENDEGATLKQVGEALGITKQRAAQIEAEAVKKLLKRIRRDVPLLEEGWDERQKVASYNELMELEV